MPKFIRDVLDLLRFRFHPLAHYVYPAWQSLLWLALIGVVGGLAAHEFRSGLLARIAFFTALNLIETIVLSAWLMAWWRWVLKRPIQGSLFPLVVLANSAQLLEPVLQLFPDSIALALVFPLALYGMLLLIGAVASALGERRFVVFIAILAYLPIALALLQVSMNLTVGWGWVDVTMPVSAPPAGALPAEG